jgi:Co/Zn/Cd efflux system component
LPSTSPSSRSRWPRASSHARWGWSPTASTCWPTAISLLAVGGTVVRKKAVAGLAGYFQLTLAAIGLVEVVRKLVGAEVTPDFSMMIVVSALALVANGTCLYLLQRAKSNEAHIRASAIFTSNDVVINLGVITAGLLVFWTSSPLPDLIVGAVVFVVVALGAVRILRLAR